MEDYGYNTQGLLSTLIYVGGYGFPITFYYDADKKPVLAKRISDYDNIVYDKYKFYYVGNRLDKIEYIYTGADSNNTKPHLIKKFFYQDNRLWRIVYYGEAEAEDQIFGRVSYVYYPNGDVKKFTDERWDATSGTYSLFGDITYEYDNRNNPFKKAAENLPGFSRYFHPSPHNVVKEIHYDGATQQVSAVITRSYTYNGKGFPLAATEKSDYPDYPSETEVLKYTYQ